jgi:molecular chaperone HtpG
LNVSDATLRESKIKQALDLARIAQGLLKGEDLTNFVKRNFQLMQESEN